MTDLGSLNFFLGISAQRSATSLFLSQSTYAEEILECAHMQKCNPCMNPVDTESKLGSDGDPVHDATLYRSLVCLHLHDPREPHLAALKRILCYVHGTIDHGIQLHVSSTTRLTAYTDVDWAGCLVTRRSTLGYRAICYRFLRSSTEGLSNHGVANVVAETAWLFQQFHVLHVPSRYQYANIFTKGLPRALFLEFHPSLNVRRPPGSWNLNPDDLTEVMRKKMGINEMPIMAVMMPGMGLKTGVKGAGEKAKGGEAKEKEKSVFDLKLEGGYDAGSKIKIIKEVRSFTDLGLKEAKELVEKAPTLLKKGVSKDEAEKIIEKMKGIGAKVVME
ncbi:ribonuclease H-like domain-containing protein [Tanacetum coccineum]